MHTIIIFLIGGFCGSILAIVVMTALILSGCIDTQNLERNPEND